MNRHRQERWMQDTKTYNRQRRLLEMETNRHTHNRGRNGNNANEIRRKVEGIQRNCEKIRAGKAIKIDKRKT